MKFFKLPTKDPFVLAVTLALLVIFFAGLASQSQESLFLGKSAFLWALIVLSGGLATGVVFVFPRFPQAIKITRRVVILTAITILLFEAIGWVFPKVLPVQLVLRLPEWTKEALPESVFDKPELRLLRLKAIDDPELGYRSQPNVNLQIIDLGIDTGGGVGFEYMGVSDSQGFNNNDESLYSDADILTTGDSFTHGWGVKFDQSWPQQLAINLNRRVLNLGMGSWSIYQYPRVMERYAPDAEANILVVALLSYNDLVDHHYAYEDYRQQHPNVKGILDYSKGKSRWKGLKRDQKNYLNVIYEASTYVLPFSTSVYSVVRTPQYGYSRYSPCEFSLAGETITLEFTAWDQFMGEGQVPTLNRVSADLSRVVDLGQSIGAQVYFLYIPYAEEVYIPLLNSATGLNECANDRLEDYKAGKFNFRKFYDQYEEALGPNANLLVDSTPYLQKFAAEGEQHNWSFDPHPNPLGFKRIGEFIADSIGK